MKFKLKFAAWGLLPLLVLAHFSHHLLAALLTPLLPYIRDSFSLDYMQAGLLVSALTLSYGLSQLPGGWLADRFGPRLLITVGVSGVALLGLLVGLAPTYLVMLCLLVLLGILGGGYHPAASPIVSASVSAARRGRALGLHQIGGSASFFLVPLLAVAIAASLGWRGAFISLSLPLIAFGIILYVLLGRRGFTGTQAGSEISGLVTVVPDGRRRLVVFTVIGIAVQVLVFTVISFIPLFIVDALGAGEAAAATLYALIFSGGIWAGPLGGYLSDRFGKVTVMVTVSLLAAPAIFLLSLVSYGAGLVMVLLVIGIIQFITMPVSEAYIITHAPAKNRSTVLGIYYFASRGGPGVVAPLLGDLIDTYGFGVGFNVIGGLMLAFALGGALFFLKKTAPAASPL